MSIAEQYNRKIFIINVPKLNVPQSIISARWPISAFTRLYAGTLLPTSIKRILYLDCDTIISGNIASLEDAEFNGNVILGVKDCISKRYKKNIGLSSESVYINAGVLLINLTELRKIDVSMRIDAFMKEYVKLISYADQDILNGIFQNKIGVLLPEYNVMTINVVNSYDEVCVLRRPTMFYTKLDFERANESPLIIHYTTNMLVVRPWFSNTDHPLSNYFVKYMSISPWKDERITQNIFSTKESKTIKLVSKLPRKVSYLILGIIHSQVKPMYILLRAKIGKGAK